MSPRRWRRKQGQRTSLLSHLASDELRDRYAMRTAYEMDSAGERAMASYHKPAQVPLPILLLTLRTPGPTLCDN